MYLKSITINNFRKYCNNQKIEFVSKVNENDISKISTLIIGKNNVGKTTIIEFLKKLIDGKFNANDFNFEYLKRLLNEYKNQCFENFPSIEGSIVISLDNEEANISNIVDLLPISEDVEEIEIKVKYSIQETLDFEENIKKEIINIEDEYKQFNKLLELINNTQFKLEYFRSDNSEVKNFKIKNLIELKVISANKPVEDNTLSKAFKKIIQFKYENEGKDDIEKHLEEINNTITHKIAKKHIKVVNDAFGSINNNKKYKMHLNGNLNFDNIFQNLIKYEYIENNNYIPENQFGLGYKNLMIIISEVIDFIQKYPNEEQSNINLIFIEEPENYMHPQMQEMFIKYINDAIKSILKNTNKKINSQLVIITHSSHIVNSKIHFANSFDNIVYLYEDKNNLLNIVNLKDVKISKKEFLPFLKKHIKFEVSNIFFADAVIVVEGLVEEILIKYFLEHHELNNYYITIFKIDGAHAFKYDKLFKLLNIPVLIITDLDIKRADDKNISDLKDKKTTNKTLKYFYNDKEELKYFGFGLVQSYNIYITTQIEPINGYFATSFEEAFVLTNHNNNFVIQALKEVRSQKYKEYLLNKDEINITKSYQIQKMLSGKKKAEFAITLIEQMTNENYDGSIKLPKYIEDGLSWLLFELEG